MTGDPSETLIYIRVRGRVPECWAPARGASVEAGVFRVTSAVADEPLEFGVGDLVRCENRCFPDGSEAMVAVGRADPR